MNIDDFLAKWFDEGSEEYIAAESDLRRILDSARATVLAEEDRRVWCERHAHYTANSGMGSSGAVEYANAELNRYREARAAWDARKEDQR